MFIPFDNSINATMRLVLNWNESALLLNTLNGMPPYEVDDIVMLDDIKARLDKSMEKVRKDKLWEEQQAKPDTEKMAQEVLEELTRRASTSEHSA